MFKKLQILTIAAALFSCATVVPMETKKPTIFNKLVKKQQENQDNKSNLLQEKRNLEKKYLQVEIAITYLEKIAALKERMSILNNEKTIAKETLREQKDIFTKVEELIEKNKDKKKKLKKINDKYRKRTRAMDNNQEYIETRELINKWYIKEKQLSNKALICITTSEKKINEIEKKIREIEANIRTSEREFEHYKKRRFRK